jgi:hypothetical protein
MPRQYFIAAPFFATLSQILLKCRSPTFAHYIAECDDTENASARHACSAAEVSYNIEFGAKRALDDMMLARSTLQTMSIAEPVSPAVHQLLKEATILEALQDAARLRFQALRSSGGK